MRSALRYISTSGKTTFADTTRRTIMSFFRRSTTPPQAPNWLIEDETEACAAVLYACLIANELDGEANRRAFRYTISTRNQFKGKDADALEAAAQAYYERAGSFAELMDAAIGAIKEYRRLPLYLHCLDVILADGVVTPREHEVFQYLTKCFRIDEDTSNDAMNVLVAKNQL
jgi:uncharacterized tellurite resistance protein B-like protein